MRDIVVDAQRDVVLDFGPITRDNLSGVPVAIDLAQNGTKLWFTVKRQVSDLYANAVIAKTYAKAGGVVTANGITVSTPATTTGFNGTVEISDTEIVVTEFQSWVWDLTLEEPDGRRETVDRGAFKVRLSVTTAA